MNKNKIQLFLKHEDVVGLIWWFYARFYLMWNDFYHLIVMQRNHKNSRINSTHSNNIMERMDFVVSLWSAQCNLVKYLWWALEKGFNEEKKTQPQREYAYEPTSGVFLCILSSHLHYIRPHASRVAPVILFIHFPTVLERNCSSLWVQSPKNT